MNDHKLTEIGEPLEISENDVKTLKKANLGERLFSTLGNKFIILISLLSGVQGLSIGTYYSYRDGLSYPGSYEPPGGWFAPIYVFGLAAGGAGTAGAAYVKKRKTHNMGEQLFLVMATVLFAFLAFTFAYVFTGPLPNWSITLMYGVYSKEDGVGAA